MIRVVLAQPRGFCAGVERAIEIVERAIEKYGPPIYVRHEIVHNRHVVERLRAKGARFVDEIDEIPPGAVTIFSAHGVASAIETRAGERGLPVIDATCPLVSKVHIEGQRYANQGREIILIGHAGHPEIEGTMGRITGKVHLISRPEEVAALAGARLDRAGDAVRAEDRHRARRNLVDLVDEPRTLGAQPLDDVPVVHDLVADVDRRPVLLDRALDDLDRALDAGAKPARLGQDYSDHRVSLLRPFAVIPAILTPSAQSPAALLCKSREEGMLLVAVRRPILLSLPHTED